jgi:hypothetical protein
MGSIVGSHLWLGRGQDLVLLKLELRKRICHLLTIK